MQLNYRLRCRDGEFRWFYARGASRRGADGTALRFAGAIVPMDDKIKHEEELAKTLIRFELSREMISDGIGNLEVMAGDPVNPNNAFWWSPQFRRLLGFETEAEFPNVMDSWSSRLHPEDKQGAIEAFVRHLTDKSGRTPFDEEYRLRCKDEQYRWFRARGQTQRASDGTPLRAVGALLDIDGERIAAQDEEKRRNYQQQLEASIKDIAGIVDAIQMIARQTNLIALNAAVEAARAGTAGRGFSVIAGEVRSLSSRTTDATAEILRIRNTLEQSRQ